MKKKRFFYCLLPLVLLLSSCSTSNPTVVTTSIGTSSNSSGIIGGATNLYLDEWTNLPEGSKLSLNYDGRGIDIKLSLKLDDFDNHNNINGLLIFFVNNRIVPTSLNGGKMQEIHYLDRFGTNELHTFDVFLHPEFLNGGEIAYLSGIALFGYDLWPNSIAYATPNIMEFPVRPIHIADHVTPSQSPESASNAFEEVTCNNLTSITAKMSEPGSFEFSEITEEGLHLIVNCNQEDYSGEYTALILLDGKIIPAFDNKRYLDWGASKGINQKISTQISTNCIPSDGKHILIGLILQRADSESLQPISMVECQACYLDFTGETETSE